MADHAFRQELGQQLRVDSVRCSTAAGSGHPTSSMSAADLMAVLLDGHLRLDYAHPERPAQRPPDLLQGARVAAVLQHAQGGRRDRRRGVADATGSSAAGSKATPRRGSRRRTSPPARSGRACPSASASRWQASGWTGCRTGFGCCAATPRWPRARSGRPSSTPPHFGSGQPDRDRGRQPARPDHGDHARLGRRDATPRGPARSAGTPSPWTAMTSTPSTRRLDRGGGHHRQPTVLFARTMKGKGVKAVEDLPGKHGKPLDDPEAAIAELGGERDLTVRVPTARQRRRAQHVPDRRRAAAELAAGGAGRHPAGLRRGAGRARRERAGTWSRWTARCRTPPTASCSPTRTRTGTSRCSSPSSR